MGGTNEIECLLPFIIELTNEFTIRRFFLYSKNFATKLNIFFIMRINPTTSDPAVSIREKNNLGRIAQIIGPVLDVAFPPGKMPNIYAHATLRVRLTWLPRRGH